MSIRKIEKLKDLELYAWVGDDELGDTGLGLKQGLTPSGMIPLVAVHKEKMNHPILIVQMEQMVKEYGKSRYLCRFKFDKIERSVHRLDEADYKQ